MIETSDLLGTLFYEAFKKLSSDLEVFLRELGPWDWNELHDAGSVDGDSLSTFSPGRLRFLSNILVDTRPQTKHLKTMYHMISHINAQTQHRSGEILYQLLETAWQNGSATLSDENIHFSKQVTSVKYCFLCGRTFLLNRHV